MTPEEFAEIILEGDVSKLIAAVADLDELQRRKLAKMAARIESSTYTGMNNKPDKELLADCRKRMQDRYRPNREACLLALVAVGSFAQVRSLYQYGVGTSREALLQVLMDRRPEWINRWIEARLNSETWHYVEWDFLRPLIRAGVCQKPTSNAYWRWMAYAPRHGLKRMLLEDADLLEDVWKFFEVETRALWVTEEDAARCSTLKNWPSALVELSQQGYLDRQRLLDASLKALNNDFMRDVLTGYMRFFERLQPTVDELACRQSALVALLANPASHVVTFAIEKISELENSGRLDGEAFLNALPPVFHPRSKGQPLAALRIVEQIVKRSPKLLPHAVAGLLAALAHPAADVQNKAIALLETWPTHLHPDHAAAIRQRLEELAPSVRPRARALADKLSAAPIDKSAASTPIDDSAARLAELVAAAEQLPARGANSRAWMKRLRSLSRATCLPR